MLFARDPVVWVDDIYWNGIVLIVNCFLQAMESKLLRGGKNIVDHTNEQQRALEQRRHEIAEQQVSVQIHVIFFRYSIILTGTLASCCC